jgi:hypothetical protein
MLIHKLEIFGDAQKFKKVKDSIDRLSDHFNLMQQHADDKIDKFILFEYTKGFAGKHLLSPIYDAIFEKKEIKIIHCRFESDDNIMELRIDYGLHNDPGVSSKIAEEKFFHN